MGKPIEIPCPVPNAKAYRMGQCNIIVSHEIYGGGPAILSFGKIRWHLSISCPNRYPTFDEIKAARYALIPDEAQMAMFFPPRKEYVNIHQNCFHLYEVVE